MMDIMVTNLDVHVQGRPADSNTGDHPFDQCAGCNLIMYVLVINLMIYTLKMGIQVTDCLMDILVTNPKMNKLLD